jgi:type IV secretory pathway TrbF-like protein
MQESLMKSSMKPELTKPTMAAEPVISSTVPVYPKARRVWFFAVIGGLLLGVLLVSLRSIIRINKENRTPVTQR